MCPLKTRKSTGKDRYRPAHLIKNALFDVFVFKMLQNESLKMLFIKTYDFKLKKKSNLNQGRIILLVSFQSKTIFDGKKGLDKIFF